MLRESIADGGIRGADHRGLSRDVDGLTRGAHFQLHVESRGRVHLQHYVPLRGLREARLGDRQRELARHFLEELIVSGVVGDRLPRSSRGRTAQRNHCARDHAALRVRDNAVQRTAGLCVERRDCGQQAQSRQKMPPGTPCKDRREHMPLLRIEV